MKHLRPLQENNPTLGELFERDICERKHGGNPQSTEAHDKIKANKSDQRERVYQGIKIWGNHGITVDEYSSMTERPPNQISGRFSELARDGRIVRNGTRKTRSGCSAAVWIIK